MKGDAAEGEVVSGEAWGQTVPSGGKEDQEDAVASVAE